MDHSQIFILGILLGFILGILVVWNMLNLLKFCIENIKVRMK